MDKKDIKGRVLKEGEDQLKDGRYRYRFTDKYGKRKAIYSWKLVTTDKTPSGKKDDLCLRAKIKQIEKDLNDNINTYKAQSKVNDLINMYLDTKVNLANSTINNYKNMYEVNIKNSLLGNMQICSVKKSDILKFYKHLYIDKKLSVGTIQLYQNLLYPAFQLAVDDSTIRLNPCKNCMKEYVRGSMDSPRIALTKEQQKKLLSFVKNNNIYKRYYTMFATVLCTGLRISEAMGLTWNNIDFKNHYITIDHQILYRKKDGTIKHYASVPKNKKTRHIPMQKDIEKLLQKYKNETYFISVSSNINIDGYTNFVFLNREEGLFTPNTLTRTCHLLRESCNKEEIEVAQWEEREPILIPDFTFHVLRHTFCTRMAEDGMDVKVLQEIMGHSNIAVTMQVYNHVSDDRAINEMNKIQNVIGL